MGYRTLINDSEYALEEGPASEPKQGFGGAHALRLASSQNESGNQLVSA
jgi:hypothetical protein